jgi:hypothetical protein
MKACCPAMSVALAMLLTAAPAQTPQREMQTGVKTTGPGWAAMTQITIGVDDLSKAQEAIGIAFGKVWSDVLEAGLTPLGPGQIVMMAMPAAPPGAGDEFNLEVQVPFAEQPTDEDLDGAGGLLIVPIEPVSVAYTYHKVAAPEAELAWQPFMDSFTRLFQWMMGRGHQPAGGPRIVFYTVGEGGLPEAAELQVPIE